MAAKGGSGAPGFRVDTAVVGPQARGRSYGLRRASIPRLDPEITARISDFAMALTGWALQRRPRFVAFFPLTASETVFAVVRGTYLGEADLGPVAIANMLIAPRAVIEVIHWRAHGLLPLLPEGDDQTFGRTPLDVRPGEVLDERRPLRESGVGLAFSDQVVNAGDDDPEAALTAMLDAVGPTELRARLTGWSTTTELAPIGSLQPTRIFKAVVHAGEEPAEAFSKTHEAKAFDHSMLEDTASRPSWAAWVRLRRLAETWPAALALGDFAWSSAYDTLDPQTLATNALLHACSRLDAPARVRLLLAVAETRGHSDPVSAAISAAVGQTLEKLMDSAGDHEGAAYYVETFLRGASRNTLKAIAAVTRLASGPEVAAWLTAAAVEDLDYNAIADRWANGQAAQDDWADRLADANPVLLRKALAAAIIRSGEPAMRRLAGSLLRLTCRSTQDDKLTYEALRVLLGQKPSVEDVELADSGLIDAVDRLPPLPLAALVDRAVTPAVRRARTIPQFMRALDAQLHVDRVARNQ